MGYAFQLLRPTTRNARGITHDQIEHDSFRLTQQRMMCEGVTVSGAMIERGCRQISQPSAPRHGHERVLELIGGIPNTANSSWKQFMLNSIGFERFSAVPPPSLPNLPPGGG